MKNRCDFEKKSNSNYRQNMLPFNEDDNECSGMALISAPLYFATFISYILRYHHLLTSLQSLNSPPPHLFEHLLTSVDIFFTLLHEHWHLLQCFGSIYTTSLLISRSSPHSMTKCLTVPSSLPHSRQYTAPSSKPCLHDPYEFHCIRSSLKQQDRTIFIAV